MAHWEFSCTHATAFRSLDSEYSSQGFWPLDVGAKEYIDGSILGIALIPCCVTVLQDGVFRDFWICISAKHSMESFL